MSSQTQTPAKRHARLSTIESSVTRVIVATKHLLESLTQWAKHSASENDISDAYVQLGNEFKVACRAFSNAGVDVSDLGDVPHSLRVVLEEALCEPPSQESLDKFLPDLREIIVNLLQSLKTKQMVARTLRTNVKLSKSSDPTSTESHKRDTSASSSKTNSSNNSRQRISSEVQANDVVKEENSNLSNTKPPALKTPAANALVQLQKGDSLQRRASRRFSAYQYAKLTSYSPGRDPDLPSERAFLSAKNVKSPLPRRNSAQNSSSQVEAREIAVFLKIGDKVKKSALTLPVSTTSLRLLFVEKFAYSPGSGSFPDIYITDPVSGISYELEEHLFSDVKENVILSLNIKSTLNDSKKSDKDLQNLEEKLTSSQQALLQETKDYIDDSKKEFIDNVRQMLNEIPKNAPSVIKSESPLPKQKSSEGTISIKSDLAELLDIRHDLSIISQIQSTNKKSFQESIDKILSKVHEFKTLSLDTSKSSNRAYLEDSQQKLSQESDSLLTKFDDLQDIIEDLRKDVAQRGARPSVKQIDYVSKQIAEAQNDLTKMNKYISIEKPNWKKIWESELDTVCSEQQLLTLQEDLALDLKEDLEKAVETFNLVKQCCEEQNKNPRTRTARLPIPEPGSLGHVRDALLSEVQALHPDHNIRVEAIEKAEKLRLRERELSALSGFEEELGGFVEDSKLKKSGGIEEVERLRRMKDEHNLKSTFAPF